ADNPVEEISLQQLSQSRHVLHHEDSGLQLADQPRKVQEKTIRWMPRIPAALDRETHTRRPADNNVNAVARAQRTVDVDTANPLDVAEEELRLGVIEPVRRGGDRVGFDSGKNQESGAPEPLGHPTAAGEQCDV